MYKNLVFDIGNVVVRWSPELIISKTFDNDLAKSDLIKDLFKHEWWLQLNRGELTEQDAKRFYKKHLGVSEAQINRLFENIKTTQTLIEGIENLLLTLFKLDYHLYALTDNVKEIILYLKNRYDFWQYFSGVIVSADVGHLKPSEQIFSYLIKEHQLDPKETIFIDDVLRNVNGAKHVGMTGILFSNVKQCKADLVGHGITI